ncbi:AvrD family protein [Pseudolactococcus yaeyamensis]
MNFFKDIDDILGDKATRYFGSGYKQVTYDILELILADDIISATTTIHYPLSWSRKDNETELVPHLSTIDATYIGLQLCESFLTQQFGLALVSRSDLFIKRLHLKAKNGVLENLSQVACKIEHSVNSGVLYDEHKFSGQIGNIVFYSEIEMPTNLNTNKTFLSHHFRDVAEILGNPASRYLGEMYRQTQHKIKNIETDCDNLISKAEIEVSNQIFDFNYHQGLDATYLSNLTPSVLDCIVAIAQLSQVLLYEMDDLNRKNSQTLWMRQIKIERHHASQDMFQPSMIKVEKSKVIRMKEGKWRMVDLAGTFYNYNFQYSLAHILPEEII